MSSFAVLRLRKRKLAAAAAMTRHALRDGAEVRNADPARAGDNAVLVGPSTAAEATRALRDALPEKRRKNAVEAIELLVTASPEAMGKKSQKAQAAYFRDALAWIGKRFGGAENIKLAVVHRDETTAHMQVLLVPMLDGKLAGSKLCGGPADMRQMQTSFAEQVGKKHNLVRGLERKPGEARPPYQSIRRWYAAIAAAGSVQAIPPVRPVPAVPEVPEPPGLLSGLPGTAARARAQAEHEKALEARKKALAARDEAIKANKARTELVAKLATVGLAVYGRDARSVGERLAKAQRADNLVAEARTEFNGLAEQNEALTQDVAALTRDLDARRQVLQLGQLEAYREQLLAEVQQLEIRLRPDPHRPR